MTDNNKPEKKLLPPEEWLATLPSKRMATQVMYRNMAGEILLVKPSYRDDWLLPGGIVEAGESPLEGALREVEEELGFKPDFLVFAGIDYQTDTTFDEFDFLHVFFDGGVLNDDQVEAMSHEEGELEGLKFVSLDAIDEFVNPHQAQRIHAFFKSFPTPILLSDGVRMSASAPGMLAPQLVAMASAVVIRNKDKYLLVQEARGPAIDKWNFPVGKVDAGETPEIAAVREAREEVGLTVELDRMLVLKRNNKRDTVLLSFAAKQFSGKIDFPEHEIKAAQWFGLDEVHAMSDQIRDFEFIVASIKEFENEQ